MSRLDEFVHSAKRRVAAGFYRPVGKPMPRGPDFMEALDRHDAIIAELKPRSPSQGTLLTLAPEQIVAAYVDGGCAALSVLTDPDHFGGDPALLRMAAEAGRPVLMKDFIIDQSQIECAAHNGASAILLIERILTPTDREALVKAAHDLGLKVLLEVFNADDWKRASMSAADMIGVNARDLETLELDMDMQLGLVREIADARRFVVALSGIRDRYDRIRARRAGARAVLVGTALMRHRDPALAITGLRRALVKACGMRTPDDVMAATAAGADLIGFVVGAPGTPRNLSVEEVRRLAALVRDARARSVLVTPVTDPDTIVEWARDVHVNIVQVHGTTDGLRERLNAQGAMLFAAIGPDEPMPMDVDGIVLDSAVDGATGGTGTQHDWGRAAARARLDPTVMTLIAGGIQPEEAGTAITAAQTWGVDASGGLEDANGVKDAQRIADYVRFARRGRP